MRDNRREIWNRAARLALLRDYVFFRLTGHWSGEPSLLGIGGLYHLVEDRMWEEMLEFLGLPNFSEDIELRAADEAAPLLGSGGEFPEELGVSPGTPVVPGCLDQV